jgi:RND superfamily putative drug exporter
MKHLTLLEGEIRRLLPVPLQKDTQIFVSGSAASIRDLKAVTDRDQIRIDLLVIVGVFTILALLLRKIMLCTYLILTVLFSYLVALGATYAFFALTEPQFAGLDWKVPMFLFTILIAVGEDYNIFLMTRIEEEQLTHGPVKGVIEALAKTGRIISSCGIIMAGTFASLCAGSLKGMIQLGFALAFGVLLDTFVVRPVLVPAYLVLLHSGRFGKFGTWLGGPPVEPVTPK